MKNLVATILSASILASGVASALDMEPKFYFGAEGQLNRSSSTKQLDGKINGVDAAIKRSDNKDIFKKGGNGLGLFVGSRINENVGVEFGYSFLRTAKTTLAALPLQANGPKLNLTGKSRNMYLDILGYVPANDEVDIVGSIGIGRLSTHVKSTSTNANLLSAKDYKSSKAGIRAGLGAQFKFNENMFGRLMATYQKGNKVIKNVTGLRLGVAYQF